MSVDEISKMILTLALAFSLVGISIQIIRLLGTFNEMLKDVRMIGYQVAKLLEKVKEDYGNFTRKLGDLAEPVLQVNDNFIKPVAKFATTAGSFVSVAHEKIFGDDDA